MVKLRGPLMSLGAQGTMNRQVTYSRHKGIEIAKTIPTHPDARTTRQLYHRWRFKDASYYWRHLTNAQRQAYEDAAGPLNMNGWAYFLSIYLAQPIDQQFWARMDEPGGATCADSSDHDRTVTFTGTTIVPGVLDNCRLFDGVDDYGAIGLDQFNHQNFTVMGWIRTTLTGDNPISNYYRLAAGQPEYGWFVTLRPNGRFTIQINGNTYDPPAGPTVDDGLWHHICCRVNGDTVTFHLAGSQIYANVYPAPPDYSLPVHSYLGCHWEGARTSFWNGYLDDWRLYDRLLTGRQIEYIATEERFD